MIRDEELDRLTKKKSSLLQELEVVEEYLNRRRAELLLGSDKKRVGKTIKRSKSYEDGGKKK